MALRLEKSRFSDSLGGVKGNIEAISNICLYLWAVIGLFLIFYCLVRYIKKYSHWILATFILFGGLDFIIYFLENHSFPDCSHLEWWGTVFSYSANTTQLYWVFNQSIPIWLIVVLLLLLISNKKMAGWGALVFAYSPFAIIGMVPITIAALFNLDYTSFKIKIKSAVTIENTIIPIVMLLVFGSFYMCTIDSARSESGFLFLLVPEFRIFTLYIAFVVIEFLVYFILMGRMAMQYRFYWITLIELLLFPLFKMGLYNDLPMRGSMLALFILMILCLQFLMDENINILAIRKKAVLACLLVGFGTSYAEIQRNVKLTLTMNEYEYLKESVYSFGAIQTDDEPKIQIILNQYMSLEETYETTHFYKYLLKK